MAATTDPYEGTADVGLMPTYHCEACGAQVWDEAVLAALSGLGRSDSPADVDAAVAGAECPACGHAQQR